MESKNEIENEELRQRLADANSVISEKTGGIGFIIRERWRQMADKGFDASHDDIHSEGEMAAAASAYACPKAERKMDPLRENKIPWVWPWEDEEWKPGPTRIRELTKAGALIVAEIERLLRKEKTAAKAAK